MIRYLPALLIGTIAASSSVLFIKASTIPPGYLGSLRLVFAALLFIIPAVLDYRKRYPVGSTGPGIKTILRYAGIPGILLGFHFITWNMAARMTLAANASLIVNMIPLVMPILAFFLYRQSLAPREAVGSVLALGGILVLGAGSVELDPAYLTGDLMALFSMTFFASYLILAKGATRLPLLAYLVGVYSVGSLTAFLGGLILDGPFELRYLQAPEVLYALGLTLGPTMLGHTFMNLAMRHLPSQVVSIAQLTQFMWASFFAWLLFREVPSWAFLPAATMVLTGGFLSISAHWRPWSNSPKSS